MRALLCPCGGAERLLQPEIANVQSRADNRAFDTVGHQLGQRPDVGQRGDPPTGDDASVGTFANAPQQVEVRTGQHAIGGHVGDHISATAGRVQPLQRGVQLATVAGPAPGSQGVAPDVEPDRDPVTEGADDLLTPFGAFQGCGTDVDPSAAGRQRTIEAGVVSDTAREFDVEARLSRDLGDELGVVAAAEGRIEIDQMQPLSTRALPAVDGRPGITEPLLTR